MHFYCVRYYKIYENLLKTKHKNTPQHKINSKHSQTTFPPKNPPFIESLKPQIFPSFHPEIPKTISNMRSKQKKKTKIFRNTWNSEWSSSKSKGVHPIASGLYARLGRDWVGFIGDARCIKIIWLLCRESQESRWTWNCCCIYLVSLFVIPGYSSLKSFEYIGMVLGLEDKCIKYKF